jgi:hypothetical protein
MHKIGDTVWVFDRNFRRYRTGPDGRSVGPPIFREHFRPVEIVGETPRSWIIGSDLKIPKKGEDIREGGGGPYGKTIVYMTQEAVDAAVFRNDHQYKIARAVEACTDVAVLRQVAALVGYKEE